MRKYVARSGGVHLSKISRNRCAVLFHSPQSWSGRPNTLFSPVAFAVFHLFTNMNKFSFSILSVILSNLVFYRLTDGFMRQPMLNVDNKSNPHLPTSLVNTTSPSQNLKICQDGHHPDGTPKGVTCKNVTLPLSSEIAQMTDGTKYKGELDVDQVSEHKSFSSKESAVEESRQKVEYRHTESPNEVVAEIMGLTVPGGTLPPVASKRIQTTTAAGIAAAICITIALSGYVCIILWRKYQLNQQGGREELINEEDVEDADLRHFEATTIQIQD